MRSIEPTISDEGTGSTFTAIGKDFLYELSFTLPPLKEQDRIVAKIEELFSELDQGVESLKTARAQLHVYRQAVLKHAFEGRLTAQWREENKDKLEKPEQLLARIKRERAARYERQLEGWHTAVQKWEGGGKRGKKPRKPSTPKPLTKLDDNRLPNLQGGTEAPDLGDDGSGVHAAVLFFFFLVVVFSVILLFVSAVSFSALILSKRSEAGSSFGSCATS